MAVLATKVHPSRQVNEYTVMQCVFCWIKAYFPVDGDKNEYLSDDRRIKGVFPVDDDKTGYIPIEGRRKKQTKQKQKIVFPVDDDKTGYIPIYGNRIKGVFERLIDLFTTT